MCRRVRPGRRRADGGACEIGGLRSEHTAVTPGAASAVPTPSAGADGETCHVTMQPDAAARLRILCLHGYAQNGDFFRARTGALRKALKADFHFPTAPHPATAAFVDGSDADTRGTPTAWWNAAESDKRPSTSAKYEGYAESIDFVRTVIETDGPFDGVLGFSQGATIATLLCLASASAPPFRFAILFSGFFPRDATAGALVPAAALEMYAATGNVDPPGADGSARPPPMPLPSVHFVGESDGLVPRVSSESLSACFDGGKIVDHAGGHCVPGTAPVRNALKLFVREHAVGGAPPAAPPAPPPD